MIQIQGIDRTTEQETAREPEHLYLVRRNIPGPRFFTADEVLRRARQSTGTISRDVHWVEGFATDDRVLLVYSAPNEAIVRRHAELSGLAGVEIVEVKRRLGARAAAA